jgi:glutamyl/glutaminyl-tRNA synthetase
MAIGRFAPTTSGRAHPGTLLAALLAWLDVRKQNGNVLLRFENLDPAAADPAKLEQLQDDLVWFGLDWDATIRQSDLKENHEAALDRLAEQGRLYACSCTRSTVRSFGISSASGGWVYPGTCRHRRVHDWRSCQENLRCDVGNDFVEVHDEDGTNLSQNVTQAMGDPIVRRLDGGVTYQLAVVADDAAAGVTRVVRGQDIASSTATQAALWDFLGAERPSWRHHLLLLEPHGEKLAKFHQSVGANVLRQFYSPGQLRALLAQVAGLFPSESGAPLIRFDPRRLPELDVLDLLESFAWDKIETAHQVLDWDGEALIWHRDVQSCKHS